ncbi:BspA family leucine-rich repeat surface protein [Mycoplasma mycoides]|uniref:BspA family leucine-rich repeat surface protein n=1 Tax=Mycoplasma mycoides TaxID=2102 RepID=UPI002ACDB976|nr:BspA family leucine-rich repeat surface protein [Mycoplasma mycoides]
MFKQAIYNANKTECLEIGYFKNWKGVVEIEKFSKTVKKVSKTLPKEITSLSFAFQGNKNKFIDAIQYWNTSKITNMSGFFDCTTSFNQDIYPIQIQT